MIKERITKELYNGYHPVSKKECESKAEVILTIIRSLLIGTNPSTPMDNRLPEYYDGYYDGIEVFRDTLLEEMK